MSALSMVKRGLRGLGVDTTRLYQRLSAASIDAAIREQGLADLVERLRAVLPDVSDQYTAGFDRREYERFWERKMRGLHAFQIGCVLDALDVLGGGGKVLADIGDSSGNHAIYLKALAASGRVDRVVSVNLDPVAIDKVRAKGGDAVLCRAEEMDLEGISPDLFMSFEMVEHLTDPLRFLHRLATRGKAEHLLFTVPFRRRSRFGGIEVRESLDRLPARLTPEMVHIFELSPEDWRLLAYLAGFETVWTRLYRQYPVRGPLRLMQPLWERVDHEGFAAFFCRRDLSLASRYDGW
jgi:2-polyprenyl-3-methyl-5-hydroxy-6-metoxy-1,4-benzoquinol methylase